MQHLTICAFTKSGPTFLVVHLKPTLSEVLVATCAPVAQVRFKKLKIEILTSTDKFKKALTLIFSTKATMLLEKEFVDKLWGV